MNRAVQWLLFAALLLPGRALGDTNGIVRYRAIAERNTFGLKPPAAVSPSSSPEVEPKEDLLLTGVSSVGGIRCALFMVVEPGKPPSHFLLHEGEQNAWLEVRAINSDDGTVRGLLKKPVMRMRTVGAEVVLSFLTPPGSRHNKITFETVSKKIVTAERSDALVSAAVNKPPNQNSTP